MSKHTKYTNISDNDALNMPISEKIDILFRWAEKRGVTVTYQAIGAKTNIAWTTIQKARTGAIDNPTFRTMVAIAEYFEVDLNYFQCRANAECLTYLHVYTSESLRANAKQRAGELSPEALVTLDAIITSAIEYMEEKEGLSRDHLDSPEDSE